jgi:hypothetical protein
LKADRPAHALSVPARYRSETTWPNRFPNALAKYVAKHPRQRSKPLHPRRRPGSRDTWLRDAWLRDAWLRDTWLRDTWLRDTWLRGTGLKGTWVDLGQTGL